jgi:hypothetical protein
MSFCFSLKLAPIATVVTVFGEQFAGRIQRLNADFFRDGALG